MHSQFTSFALDKLNKGKLLVEINHDMAQLQQAMADFADRYGAEAEKAKAVLTIKLSIICVDPDSAQFAVKSETASTLPKRPADVAVAFLDEDESGKPEMVVRTFAQRESEKDKGPKLPLKYDSSEGNGLAEGERVNTSTGEVHTVET